MDRFYFYFGAGAIVLWGMCIWTGLKTFAGKQENVAPGTRANVVGMGFVFVPIVSLFGSYLLALFICQIDSSFSNNVKIERIEKQLAELQSKIPFTEKDLQMCGQLRKEIREEKAIIEYSANRNFSDYFLVIHVVLMLLLGCVLAPLLPRQKRYLPKDPFE